MKTIRLQEKILLPAAAFLLLLGFCGAVFGASLPAAGKGLFEPLQITAETEPVTAMDISQDGAVIVYITASQGTCALWRASADPGTFSMPRQLVPAASAKRAPALAPDGGRIAYVDTRFDAKGDIYLIDPKTPQSPPKRLTGRETADGAPVFSPDGEALYFHQTGKNGRRQIVFLDLSKPGAAAEPVDTKGDAAFPALSPDGGYLAFVSARNDPSGDIYICRLQNRTTAGPAIRATCGRAIDSQPAWAPAAGETERTLYFSRIAADTSRDGRLNTADNAVICRIHINGDDTAESEKPLAFPLTLLRHYAAAPAVTQDRLYYLTNRKSVSNCWAIPRTGRIETKRTAGDQMALAEAIAGRIPYDPYTALVAYSHVMERFPEPPAIAARAGLSVARIYERLNLTAPAKTMAAHVAGRFSDVQPESAIARLRKIEFEARTGLKQASTKYQQAQTLESAITNIDRIAGPHGLEPSIRAEAAFARIRLMIKAGRASENISRLLGALNPVIVSAHSKPSDRARALFLKGRLLDRAGLSERANTTWRRLLKEFPEQRPWSERAVARLLDAAAAALPEGQPGEQIKTLRRMAADTRDRLPVISMAATNRIGDIYYARDQWANAKSAYQSVIHATDKLTPQTAAARFSLAEILYREERFRKALNLYETMLAENQTTLSPAAERIYQLARAGYIRKTVAAGNFHYRIGELPAARNTFRELLDYDETIVQAHRGYIQCAAAAGDIEQTIGAYQKKLEARPNDPLRLYTAGLALSYRETRPALETAARKIRKAIRINGHVEYYHQTLGYILEVLETVYKQPEQLEKSLQAYKKAYFLNDPDLQPENAANLELNLGNAFYLLGQYGKALRFYTRRLERQAEFARPQTEILFYRRLGECAFQASDAARAKSAYETALGKINERMAPLAPAKSFDRLHRLARDRILAPALKHLSLEKRARELAEFQAEIAAAVAELTETAGAALDPAQPDSAWTPYQNGIQNQLERQRTLNSKLAALARDLNRICTSDNCRAYIESPEEILRLMTQNIESALSLPESLAALKAEMTDRLGLACQALEEWEAAIDAFEAVFDLNKNRGAFKNLARNRRSAAFNTYHLAQTASGDKRRRLLEKSARGFRQVLALIETHGVAKPEPEKRQNRALIAISVQTALEAGTATQAARGFSRVQEKRLAHAFLSRIALELGDLERARKDLDAQLAEYPIGKAVSEKNRYGVALLYHRAGLLAHAMGDDETAWDRFAYSTDLCLKMQAPVGAYMNMINLAALLTSRQGNIRARSSPQSFISRFQTLDRDVRRLLERAAATARSLRLAEYHNAMGVCYSLMADRMEGGKAAAAARQMRCLTRAAGHFAAGLNILDENRLSPARKALEARARLHLNQAEVCRITLDPDAARGHRDKALSAARKGLLPDLEWRALAGLGRTEQALEALSKVPPDRAGCQPMEIIRAFGPLVADELREAGPEAAFNLAEKVAEMERYNRTAVFIKPREKRAKAFYKSLYPRLSRIMDYRDELSAAKPEQKPYIRERLERERSLLESEAQSLPDFAARIEDPNTRHRVMRALGALLKAADTAEKLAARRQRKNPDPSAIERLQLRHEMLMADYHAAVSGLRGNSGQEALQGLFSPQPAAVMDAAASLEPGRRLLRPFPKGPGTAGYILFTLLPDDISAQTIARLSDIKKFLPESGMPPAACIAYEDPSALSLKNAFPHFLSAAHLLRSVSEQKPFKQRLLEASRQAEIKALPDAFERLDWPSDARLSEPSAAYPLNAAQTLVLSRRIAASADVPTGPEEAAVPSLALYTDTAARMPLIELAARTKSLSLALIANPPETDRDRLIHLFSLYGCPTLIMPAVGTPPGRSLEPERLQSFLDHYAQMRPFDAALESLGPENLLYLGDTGMSPEAAADYAAKNFAGYVRAARRAFDAKNYGTALLQFSNAANIAAQMDAFGRYLPALFQYARESAYKTGNLERALVYARRLAGLLEKKQPDGKSHAEALLTLGLIHSRLKHYDKAVPVIESAVDMFAMLEADAKLAGAMTDLGIVLENATHYESALSRFQSAAKLSRNLDNPEMLAAQHINIGRIYDLRLDRYPEAIQHYEAALTLYQEMQATGKIAEARLDIGRCYRLLGVFTKARRFYQEALDTLDTPKTPDTPDELDAQKKEYARLKTKILIEQANNAWFQGDFEEAFRLQRTCAKLSRKKGFPLMQVVSQNTAGLIWWSLGSYEKALTELENALENARELAIRQDEVASTLNNIGLVHREMKNYEKALQTFDQALAIDEKLSSRWAMAYDHRNKGLTYLEMKQPEKALPLFEKALSLSSAIGNRINAAKAELGRANALLALNRPETAKAAFTSALALSRDMHIKETQWRALYGLGRISRDAENDPQAAEQYLREAMEIIESMRAAVRIKALKENFMVGRLDVYEALVQLLADMKRAEAAFEIAERSRSRNFIDLLGAQRIALASETETALFEKQAMLASEIEAAEQLLAAARSAEEKKTYQRALTRLQNQRENLMLDIQASHPRLSTLVSIPPVETEAIIDRLEPGVALLSYYVLDSEILCWRIKHPKDGAPETAIRLTRIPADKHKLKSDILSYRRIIQNLEPYEARAESLYERLLAPIGQELNGIHNIGIIPHGPLHYLSYATLYDGIRFFIDRAALFYLPSASVLDYTLARRIKRPKLNLHVLAIGNPELDNPALELPFAEPEVNSIQWNFPEITILTRDKATEAWVVKNIAEYDIIHIASHGEFDPVNPLMSAVKLSPAQTAPEKTAAADGDLRAADIFGLDIHADMVCLSACQTGLGKVEAGDEIIGLNRSFFYAGTHTVVSSLWRVSDVSTAMLIKTFYRRYTTQNKANSLRAAARHVRHRYPHPGYWGAFTLVGDFK